MMFESANIETLAIAVSTYLLVLTVAIFYVLYQIDVLVSRIQYSVNHGGKREATTECIEKGQENQDTQPKVLHLENILLDCADCDVLYESAKKISKPLFELTSDNEGQK